MILKFLLFVFLFFYIIAAIFKGIIRFFFGQVTNSFNQQQRAEQPNYSRRREGEVTINYVEDKNGKKNKKDNDGEYVDYIEVKD